MQFAHPKMLWLLALAVPLLSLFLFWSWRRKQYLISQFVRSRLLAYLTVGLSKTVQKTRMILIIAAVGLLILALARPQWGFAWEEAHQRGLDIIVAIDTSRSMLAEDIAPNRLARAKLAALDLLRLAERDRLGLVAFAGTAFLQCPLTLDSEAFRQSLNQLEVGIIPQGGTALAEAIQTAEKAFNNDADNHRVLVVFSDGEDHDDGAVEAAERAADAGFKIFTIGVGTPNGELLRERDEKGNVNYVKDVDGNVVKSRLNESLLTQIATSAQGFYLPMSGPSTVDVLYQRGLAPLPKGDISSKLVKQFQERFQWPLLLAILLLLIEMFLPERKRVPRTDAILQASNPELRKVLTLFFLALTLAPAQGSSASALRKYEEGRFKDAYQDYSRLLERRPSDPRLQYNAGSAAYKAKKYDDAVRHFSAASTAEDQKLQENAYYNLGNSLFRAGEDEPNAEKKAQLWNQSASQYETALKLNPNDQDARFNLDVVRKKIEELKQQQQQQQQSQDKPEKQDDQKQDDQSDQKQDQSQENKNSNQPDPKSGQKDQPKDSDQSQQPPQGDKEQKDDQQKDSQSDSAEEKKPQSKDENSSRPDRKEKESNGTNSTQSLNPATAGQMTPEQVKQLLDSQKDNEKAMIFIPPEKLKAKRPIFKDW